MSTTATAVRWIRNSYGVLTTGDGWEIAKGDSDAPEGLPFTLYRHAVAVGWHETLADAKAAAEAYTEGVDDCPIHGYRHLDGCSSAPVADAAEPEAEREVVVFLQREAGWGPWITVRVADTPEADAAAHAFFTRTPYTGGSDYSVPTLDHEATTADLGPQLAGYFFPVCEHGMDAHLCAGPGHYPADH